MRTAFLHELRLVDGIYLAGSVQPYGEIVQQLQSRDLLQVKTVYTRVYQEAIPYDQQTVERSDLGFGVVETIQQGVDGTQQLTEEITYVNGVQTAAEVVHIDILTPRSAGGHCPRHPSCAGHDGGAGRAHLHLAGAAV